MYYSASCIRKHCWPVPQSSATAQLKSGCLCAGVHLCGRKEARTKTTEHRGNWTPADSAPGDWTGESRTVIIVAFSASKFATPVIFETNCANATQTQRAKEGEHTIRHASLGYESVASMGGIHEHHNSRHFV